MYKYFFKRLFDIIASIIALPFVLLSIIIFSPIIFFTDRAVIEKSCCRAGRIYNRKEE